MIERAAGIALAVAATAAIVWGSHVPLTVHGPEDAVLRLAWGARPERIETCRDATSEELARLPRHMRQQRICEGVTAEYRLVVESEDGIRVNRVVRGGGLRRDRRLYVFEELRIPAGAVAFDVRFERITQPAAGEDESDGPADRQSGPRYDDSDRRGTVPAVLSLAVRLTARPREVVLVTYDPGRRALVVVQRSSNTQRLAYNHHARPHDARFDDARPKGRAYW